MHVTWLSRQDLEDREAQQLAGVAARSSASGGRRLFESPDPLRTDFQRDRDRIIHSAAFRRLQHKTQVFAAHEGDHYRSRLTHSLEVSQMARSVALACRLNFDLCEAVALAHDLGHPPFGHVGEHTLDELLRSAGGFRHNAHGLRIVDFLEQRNDDGHGLNLTLLVRRSLLKGIVPSGFPLSQDLIPRVDVPLEAEVVDLCDKIAYLCHDLDDALRARIVSPQSAEDLQLWRLGAERCAAPPHSSARIISEMVAILVLDLTQATTSIVANHDASTQRPRLRHSKAMAVAADELLRFLRERFYRSRRVLADMERGEEQIRGLFEVLCRDLDQIPQHYRSRLAEDGLERVVGDYIAGMTDRFLLQHQL